ncbi:MFS transporter [Paenibacillus sp. N1-5-1-14]|uniref:MFS transporter n=1 Tax=Paenibacillus radicibacter TaxID=2972488 RepID=UPI002159315D|nr:MFS transporter [Paenibacillus radicibacter]MCR8642684.1 MFS transporter [Paenibacillus radicibacter]
MSLPKELRSLLLMGVVSNIVIIYIGIFVNLYIWEQGNSIFDVTWFNLILFVAWGVAYALGSQLLFGRTIRTLYGLSATMGAIAFLVLSLLKLDNQMLWIVCIAVPVGLMQGFFSAGQNISLSTLGKGTDFANYMAISAITGNILNMTVPLLSALVIKWMGYSGSFICMFVFVGLMLLFSTKLPQVSLISYAASKGSFWQEMRIGKVFNIPGARWFILSCLAAGFILQFQGLFALLFTFSVTEDKTEIALLNMMYTFFALVALFLFKKLKFMENRWLTAAVLLLTSGMLLMLVPYPVTRICANVITTMGMFYFVTVWSGDQIKAVSSLGVVQQSRVLVWREWFLCITRIIMLILALGIKDFSSMMFIFLAMLTITCLLTVSFFQTKFGASRKMDNIDLDA